ncbi:MAG TPA: HNH endonuclease [Dokdonella sp.]|uniref:HNH endonuclease n=1 Tax=Dokdonella sp. TaxID=2291710 RepID=UPI002D7F9B6C|nr:HNH endonuclease [Dokdonella sp.]HET9031593.1 HNH endonuclease [Dokdonella sp.]
MRFWLGVTDNRWFQHVSASASPEVNFWQPSARAPFTTLPEGTLFLFKLKAPNNHIVGGGRFVRYTRLPLLSAWAVFEQQNGTSSLGELKRLIATHRRDATTLDTEIGCTVLTDVFYLPRDRWIDVGERFRTNIVVGKTYEDTDPVGASLLADLDRVTEGRSIAETGLRDERLGRPFLQRARLGQGSFRTLVIDAYARKCAITGEHTLPVLEAAHILPFAEHGPHHVCNGLLLRSDFHKLFDAGLLTVEPDLRVRVSGRIRDRYFNGKAYYRLHGQILAAPPVDAIDQPNPEYLRWHNENSFVE